MLKWRINETSANVEDNISEGEKQIAVLLFLFSL